MCSFSRYASKTLHSYKIYENTILSSFTYIYTSTNFETYYKHITKTCLIVMSPPKKKDKQLKLFSREGEIAFQSISQPDVGTQSINYET